MKIQGENSIQYCPVPSPLRRPSSLRKLLTLPYRNHCWVELKLHNAVWYNPASRSSYRLVKSDSKSSCRPLSFLPWWNRSTAPLLSWRMAITSYRPSYCKFQTLKLLYIWVSVVIKTPIVVDRWCQQLLICRLQLDLSSNEIFIAEKTTT